MKKRNKRTTIIAEYQISPLTENILARMGEEGQIIRQRLEQFLQDHSIFNQPHWERRLEKPIDQEFSTARQAR